MTCKRALDRWIHWPTQAAWAAQWQPDVKPHGACGSTAHAVLVACCSHLLWLLCFSVTFVAAYLQAHVRAVHVVHHCVAVGVREAGHQDAPGGLPAGEGTARPVLVGKQ